jgi:hypothetical protein
MRDAYWRVAMGLMQHAQTRAKYFPKGARAGIYSVLDFLPPG